MNIDSVYFRNSFQPTPTHHTESTACFAKTYLEIPLVKNLHSNERGCQHSDIAVWNTNLS